MTDPPVTDTNQNAIKSPRPARDRGLMVIAVLSLLLALGLIYRFGVHPNLFPKNFSVVEPGKLYRSGGLTPAATRRVVERHAIRTIVDLGAFDNDPALEQVAARTAEALGVRRHVFRLEGDGRGNPNAYVAALRIIADPANHPVLVHCAAGSQRTSACILLYHNIVEGKPFSSTIAQSFEHGHDPGDNRVMLPWLLDWHEAIARAYRQGTLIPGQAAPEVRGGGEPVGPAAAGLVPAKTGPENAQSSAGAATPPATPAQP